MFTTLNKDDHAKRKRILADRYANTNVVRQPSLQGISERAANFVKLCCDAGNKGLDLYVSLQAFSPGHKY